MKGGPQARVSSPGPLRSTLITSAPRSARIWPAQGPARMRASSSTRKPASGPGIRANPPTMTCRLAFSARLLLVIVWRVFALLSTAAGVRHARWQSRFPVDRHDGATRDPIVGRGQEQDRSRHLFDLGP